MTSASFPIDSPLDPRATACLEALAGQALPTFGPRLGKRCPGLELDYRSDRAAPLDFTLENGVPLIGLPRTLAGSWLVLFNTAFWPCCLSALEVEISARLVATAPPAGNSPKLNRQLARASEVAFVTVTRPWFAACGIRRLALQSQVRDLAQQPPPAVLDLGDRHPAA